MQKKEVEELGKIVEKKFQIREGPFYLSLERSLDELGVKRQAYQGGKFLR